MVWTKFARPCDAETQVSRQSCRKSGSAGRSLRKDSTVTAQESLATGVVEGLREGLAAAKREGATSVRAKHLSPELLEGLAATTLAHLRSRPGKPSPVEGWTIVTTHSAGVLSW